MPVEKEGFNSLANQIRLTRRQVLRGTLGASIASISSLSSARGADPVGGIIDAHSHIWTRDVKAFPLTRGATLKDLDPPHFTIDDLRKIASRHHVARVVLIQHHLFHGYDNSYLLHAVKSEPSIFRVVGMVDDLAADPAAKMKRLLPLGATGFRITSWIRKEKWLDGPGMAAMWRCAADTGQAICCLMDAPDLPSLEAMCRRHSKTRVVIDHFGRIGVDGQIRMQDVDRLCRLSRHKQVHVKISAYYALGNKRAPYLDLIPMIRRVLDAFGPQRCMWASDSPYQLQGDHSYGASLDLIQKRISFLSAGDREWLLRKTAEKVYFF